MAEAYEDNEVKADKDYKGKYIEITGTIYDIGVVYSIDNINEAINQKKKISYNYYDYDYKKQLVPRKKNDEKREYIATPVGLILKEDYYYVIINHDKYEELSKIKGCEEGYFYEVSKDFYVNKLGLEIMNEAYRKERDSYKLDLKLGINQIELFSFSNPPIRPNSPEACGLRRLAFEVDDIDEVVAELLNKGIDVEDIRVDEYTGCKYTFFKDPDGLPLELYEAINCSF